jgi:hypothetical protein
MARRPRNMDDYKETIRSARTVLPIAAQMEELFPVADHFIMHYAFDSDPKLWTTDAYFGGRYNLTMKVDVEIDYTENRITKVIGKPKFHLLEVSNPYILTDEDADESNRDEGDWWFGPEEWNTLYAARGDFSAIGIEIKRDPVAYFDEAVTQARSGRAHIRLLGE